MSSSVFILMGVSATGKTTLGRALAEVSGGVFYDGDDYHPASNVEKMSSGESLTDADRKPWLQALVELMQLRGGKEKPLFLACSALKKSYREELRKGAGAVVFLYLHGDDGLLRERMRKRFASGDHFMPPSLLDQQLEALEEPTAALWCDVSSSLEELVELVLDSYPSLEVGKTE